MIYSENIATAYHNRAQSENWAAWVNDNPKIADMLSEAEKVANG